MSTRDVSFKQESEIAKFLGGKVVPNSGAIKFGAGDVQVGHYCIEAKNVMEPKKSISIKKAWIDKAKEEALASGYPEWALAFRFEPDGTDYFIIDKYNMYTLISYMKDYYDDKEYPFK